jgi:hypothetical protein
LKKAKFKVGYLNPFSDILDEGIQPIAQEGVFMKSSVRGAT